MPASSLRLRPALLSALSVAGALLLASGAGAVRLADCGFEPEEAKDGSFVHHEREWTELDWQGNLWSSVGGNGVEVRLELPNGYDSSPHFAILDQEGEALEVTLPPQRGVGTVSCRLAPALAPSTTARCAWSTTRGRAGSRRRNPPAASTSPASPTWSSARRLISPAPSDSAGSSAAARRAVYVWIA